MKRHLLQAKKPTAGHPQVSRKGKDIAVMRSAYIEHTTKHERTTKKIDALPDEKRKG